MVKFLTYEAAASLNMYLASAASSSSSGPLSINVNGQNHSHGEGKAAAMRSPISGSGGGGSFFSGNRQSMSFAAGGQTAASGSNGVANMNGSLNTSRVNNKNLVMTGTPIVKALREGMQSVGLKDDTLVFRVATDEFGWGVLGVGRDSVTGSEAADSPFTVGVGRKRAGSSVSIVTNGTGTGQGQIKDAPKMQLVGNVFVVKSESLDVALWKIGGAAVALRLVQLAEVGRDEFRNSRISD